MLDLQEPLKKETFRTSRFVLCREVVLFQRYRVCIHAYKSTFGLSFVGRFVLFWSGGFTVLYKNY